MRFCLCFFSVLFFFFFFLRVYTLWKAEKQKKTNKKKIIKITTIFKLVEHTLLCRSFFFRLLRENSVKSMCYLKTTLKCTVCTKRIMLSLQTDGEWIEIKKIKEETKFKMARSYILYADVKDLVIQPLAIRIRHYRLSCCYYRHGRRINSLSQITERLLLFRISTEPPKRLLNNHIFGHTHHWSHHW